MVQQVLDRCTLLRSLLKGHFDEIKGQLEVFHLLVLGLVPDDIVVDGVLVAHLLTIVEWWLTYE